MTCSLNSNKPPVVRSARVYRRLDDVTKIYFLIFMYKIFYNYGNVT